MTVYTVWVGGIEVNDHYIDNENEAERIAAAWRANNYDDVYVESFSRKIDEQSS